MHNNCLEQGKIHIDHPVITYLCVCLYFSMTKGHECEDFVNADGSVYRSHFIVNEEDFSREIMWISDHLTLDSR